VFFATMTGATHSQRTNAGTADPRRAPSERRDPRASGTLIDQDGEMMGVMGARDAMLRAYAVGLGPRGDQSERPIRRCARSSTYGKFKYEQQKKRNEAKKKTKGHRDQGNQGPAEY